MMMMMMMYGMMTLRLMLADDIVMMDGEGIIRVSLGICMLIMTTAGGVCTVLI